MTTHMLLVPIHLDALVLTKAKLCVGPAVRFERLPHVWRGADVNPDVPNLGKSVVAPPFQDQSFLMESGVHLHWALPDGLTRAHHTPGEGSRDSGGFPAVPNRWLVVRRKQRNNAWTEDTSWVVESDYLWSGDRDPENHVSVPSDWADPDSSTAHRPFRHIGRRVPGDRYPAGLEGGGYLARPLTAMGYGDPTFAAVYQNCHSVFGLYDPEPLSVETRYDVFGWYSDPRHDAFRALLGSGQDAHARTVLMESRFGWRVEGEPIPAGTETLCFVSMTVPPERHKTKRRSEVEVSIGNTATEALSAYLAHKMGDGAKRDMVEDQLESVLLGARLSGKTLDRAARLADARHEKGFTATFGGWIWTVKPREAAQLEQADTQEEDAAPLDPELRRKLANLNELQRKRDRAVQELEAARGQLFADWCKYMHVVYPSDATWQGQGSFDSDELLVFIEQQADALDALVKTQHDRDVEEFDVAGQLVTAHIAELNLARVAAKAKPLVLRQIPGPRFYRPTEPVLLIQGDAVCATERHGQDGREDKDNMLRCALSTAALLPPGRVPDAKVLCKEIDRLRGAGPATDRIGFCTWTQPWHPILLEWEVKLRPIERGGHQGKSEYPATYIKDHYSLKADAVELAPTHAVLREDMVGKTYQGASILTPHAARQHYKALHACVIEHCGCSPEHLDEHRETLETNHRAMLSAENRKEDDPVCTALCALGELKGKTFLSQALTGINDAFLGLHQSYQLAVADPLGFAGEQDLARRVRDRVLSFNRSAPDDAGGFDPIRAGLLTIEKLRLVDTFGQIQNLKVSTPATCVSRPLRAAGEPGRVALPPRFVQPARINLRWVSDTDGTAVAASPICGWLILDNLDQSILVHDAGGYALGVISAGSETGLWRAGWQAAPGNDAALQVRHIENPHLRRVAEWLVDEAGKPEWGATLVKIETGLDYIDPEASAHHEDLAVLMGRPLAVVRAELSVSLAGPPALHQGEHPLFKSVMSGMRQTDRPEDVTIRRRTDRFEEVTIPIRLGAHQRANDGLVAYWRDIPEGVSEVQWPQSDDVTPILVAPVWPSTPVTLTMLVDPLAEVYAKSGVLPTKSITLPASMYADQLKRLEVSFRSVGPILTRIGRLDLPLPIEPGYAWSWIERDDRGWSAVAGDVGASEDDGAFSGPIVARDGWMRLTKVEAPEPMASGGSTDSDPKGTP